MVIYIINIMPLGYNDIKNHRYFSRINWDGMSLKKLNTPYVPKIKAPHDISNFIAFDESTREIKPVNPNVDPFIKW